MICLHDFLEEVVFIEKWSHKVMSLLDPDDNPAWQDAATVYWQALSCIEAYENHFATDVNHWFEFIQDVD